MYDGSHAYFVSRSYVSFIFLQVSQAEQIKQEREGEKKEDTSKDENEIGENGNAIKKEESKRNDKDGD